MAASLPVIFKIDYFNNIFSDLKVVDYPKLSDNTIQKLKKYKILRVSKIKRKKRGKRSGQSLRTTTTNISFLQWYIEGYTNAIQLEKNNYELQKYDIVTLNETFLLKYPRIEEFYVFSQDAFKKEKGRPSGGILIAVKPYLQPQEIRSTVNYIILRTVFDFVLTFYFPPQTDSEYLLGEVNEALSHVNFSERIIISGDFNCRIDTECEKSKELEDIHIRSCYVK